MVEVFCLVNFSIALVSPTVAFFSSIRLFLKSLWGVTEILSGSTQFEFVVLHNRLGVFSCVGIVARPMTILGLKMRGVSLGDSVRMLSAEPEISGFYFSS